MPLLHMKYYFCVARQGESAEVCLDTLLGCSARCAVSMIVVPGAL